MPAAAALALTLAGCSLDSGLFSKSDPKADATFALNQAPKGEDRHRVVTAADLIDAKGNCAGEAAAPQALNFTAGPQSGAAAQNPAPGVAPGVAPVVRTGVGLGMTECDVVRTLGHTDRIEISTNDRGLRSVTLTYLTGERPGIYRFEAGRLDSLERVDEAPVAHKPAKPKKAVKKQPPA
ncbi:MAG: hypothetical protein JO328_14150 [Hyphomicrobiales bacterium]|nr:hypothetical protein [Hyphomicrobiales bacterium]MBV8826593.1 hypothetical protein [Hyphomicrobiales bacterium]MBV9428282.1 hypothetical protein [Bradyrhizobiaceae bacterium]